MLILINKAHAKNRPLRNRGDIFRFERSIFRPAHCYPYRDMILDFNHFQVSPPFGAVQNRLGRNITPLPS